MRKITLWAGACCLVCLAILTLMLIASHLLTPSSRAIYPEGLSPIRVSESGVRSLSVFEAIVDNSYEIFVADDRTGQTRQLTTHFANDRFPTLSPDGNKVAFVSWRDGDSDIYVIDLATGALRNVSNHAGRDMLPVWSPDGAMLAYVSDHNGNYDICLVDVGRGLMHDLTVSLSHDSQPVWFADGRGLVFTSNRGGTRRQYMIDVGGHNVTLYAAETQWRAAQNVDMMENTQGMMPG